MIAQELSDDSVRYGSDGARVGDGEMVVEDLVVFRRDADDVASSSFDFSGTTDGVVEGFVVGGKKDGGGAFFN